MVTTGMGEGVLCTEGFFSGGGISIFVTDGGGERAFGCGGVGGGREISFLIGLIGRISLGVDGALTSEACRLPSDGLPESMVFSFDLSEAMVPALSNSSGSSISYSGREFTSKTYEAMIHVIY